MKTKPEAHDVLHCHQKQTKTWTQITCTEYVVKFGHLVFKTCSQTGRQTYGHDNHYTSHNNLSNHVLGIYIICQSLKLRITLFRQSSVTVVASVICTWCRTTFRLLTRIHITHLISFDLTASELSALWLVTAMANWVASQWMTMFAWLRSIIVHSVQPSVWIVTWPSWCEAATTTSERYNTFVHC